VYCQLVNICGCIPARIRHALVGLPETLDGTYERTLREINKEDWEFAHRLLQFVAVAVRPLRVEELAELLAFDFKAGSIPKFHEDWRSWHRMVQETSRESYPSTAEHVEGREGYVLSLLTHIRTRFIFVFADQNINLSPAAKSCSRRMVYSPIHPALRA